MMIGVYETKLQMRLAVLLQLQGQTVITAHLNHFSHFAQTESHWQGECGVRYRGMVHCLSRIVSEEGLVQLYQVPLCTVAGTAALCRASPRRWSGRPCTAPSSSGSTTLPRRCRPILSCTVL